MPNDNVIVDLVTGIEPPLENRPAVEVLREHPEGVDISFDESTAVRLLPGDIAAGQLEILDQLRQLGQPVYIEFEPDSRAIVRMLIPLVSRVDENREDADIARVTLEASHAIHLLDRGAEGFEDMRATLDEARASRNAVVVTETDDHRIIDVRRWEKRPFPPEPPGTFSSLLPGLLLRFWRWLCHWFCCWFRCVSFNRARQLFNQMSAQTCNPLTVPTPCIPFLYPDDGCWARAHEMCRLMLLQGARPRKVWIDGFLQTPTRNHPNCIVYWGWHVAPTLCVRRWWRFFPLISDMVIDPSLFTGPVSTATWKAAQGDPSATLTPSAASLYWRNVMPSDPGYVDTNSRLAYYRLQLKNRSLQPAGPPPYATCP